MKVFNLINPPHTATYLEVINRSIAFTDNELLTEQLQTRLVELNTIRNNLEHYAIDSKLEKIENLILKLKDPILSLFKSTISDFKSKHLEDNWAQVDDSIKFHKEKEKEIIELLEKLKTKPIPGIIFSNLLGGQLQLPDFTEILQGYQIEFQNRFFETDIFAKAKTENWIIEIKLSKPNRDMIHQLEIISKMVNATPWLISYVNIPKSIKDYANEKKVYLTDIKMLNNLKSIAN